MTISEALNISLDDTIFDLFGDRFTINSINIERDGNKIKQIIFCGTDCNGDTQGWTQDVLYTDLDLISDEDRAFIEWSKENKDYIYRYENSINMIKQCFISGYTTGWQNRLAYNAMENLQK